MQKLSNRFQDMGMSFRKERCILSNTEGVYPVYWIDAQKINLVLNKEQIILRGPSDSTV